jgi:hypothetical protein
MQESQTCNRRTMLCLMSSALAFASLPLLFPVKSVAKALRQGRGHRQARSVDHHTYQGTQTYLGDTNSLVALDRFKHQVHEDFVAGRITVVDGWVLSESEMALLVDRKASAIRG